MNIIQQIDLNTINWIRKEQNKALKQMNKVLYSFRSRVLADLKRSMKGSWQHSQLLSSMRSINSNIETNNAIVKTVIKSNMKKWANQEYKAYTSYYGDSISTTFTNINRKAMNGLYLLQRGAKASASMKGKGYTVDATFNNRYKYMSQSIFKTLNTSYTQGWGYQETKKHLMKTFRFSEIAAQRNIRTYGQLARNFGQFQFMNDNPKVFKKWVWVAMFDLRTCDQCADLHGKEFTQATMLADHWNGHCDMVPLPDKTSSKTMLNQRRIRNPITQKQELINGNPSYQSWLADKINSSAKSYFNSPAYLAAVKRYSKLMGV